MNPGFRLWSPGLMGFFARDVSPVCGWMQGALWDLDLPRMNKALEAGLATPEHAEFVAQLAAARG